MLPSRLLKEKRKNVLINGFQYYDTTATTTATKIKQSTSATTFINLKILASGGLTSGLDLRSR